MKPKPSFDVVIEIPFHDVDSMGVVWHGHYVKYLEIARTALCRSLGLDIQEMRDTGILWPVVACQLKYVQPLRYGQKVRVRATLEEWENRIRIAYLLTGAESGAVINKASTIQVPIDAKTGELLFDVPASLFPCLESR